MSLLQAFAGRGNRRTVFICICIECDFPNGIRYFYTFIVMNMFLLLRITIPYLFIARIKLIRPMSMVIIRWFCCCVFLCPLQGQCFAHSSMNNVIMTSFPIFCGAKNDVSNFVIASSTTAQDENAPFAYSIQMHMIQEKQTKVIQTHSTDPIICILMDYLC